MKIKVEVTKGLDTSMIAQTICFLMKHFTRSFLREYASKQNIRRGRDKINTIHNLIDAGCVETITGGALR